MASRNKRVYTPRTAPMAHQKAALVASSNKPNQPSSEDVFAYLADMGTGKSKMILDEFGEMATSGGPQDLLVVAPAGSYRNWFIDKGEGQLSEINSHLDKEFRERLVDVGWISGGGRDNEERIRAMMSVTDRPRALFVNVEALSSVKKAQDLVKEFLSQRLAYMAIDESTTIKNPRALRTKQIVNMGEDAAVRRIATGLLTPRSPLDMFSQFEFLDWRILGFRSFYAFRARYAIMKKMEFGGRKVNIVVGYRNLDELQELIKPYSFRVLKQDCLDLAPKTYMSRDVELTNEQRRVYKDLREQAMSMMADGSFVNTESVIQQLIRLHQVNLGYVVDENGQVHHLPERRTDALVEVLEQHRGKAVIWCPFTIPLHRIADRLREEFGKKSVAMFWGGNKNTRADEEKRFLNDPECKYMCATQGAGMRGNTWVVADLNCYYANSYDLEQRNQSEDRIHRKGQTKKVTNIDFIARGTVDEKMVKALREKMTMSTTITGENYREWLI